MPTTTKLFTPVFITMGCANFFITASYGALFLFPLFVTGHGGGKVDIGYIMGAFTLASVLFRPWISEIIDRLGRKKSYTVGSVIMTVAPLLYLFLHGSIREFYPPLLAVRLLHGVGLAFCFTAAFTYIADILPRERFNEGIGMFGVAGLTGIALGPVMAEAFIDRYGFEGYFVGVAVLAFLGLVLHLRLPESFTSVAHGSARRFFAILLRRRTLFVVALSLLFGFGLAASNGFVAPFAKEERIRLISLYFLSYSAAAVAVRVFGGKIADRVGEGRVIPYALGMTGGGLLSLIFLNGIVVLTLSGILTGAGHGLLYPCLNAMAVRDEPIGIRGKLTGIFTGGIDFGAFVGSLSLGYVGEWTGYRTIFLLAGLALCSGLVIYLKQRNLGSLVAARVPETAE